MFNKVTALMRMPPSPPSPPEAKPERTAEVASAKRRIMRAIDAELDELSPGDALALAEDLRSESWLLFEELQLDENDTELYEETAG